MEKKKTKICLGGKIALGILIFLISVLALSIIVGMIINHIGNKANTELALSFKPIVNENAIVPQKDENGDWCFVTDRELKVLQITDIHLGCGWMSLKKDSLAINTVASMVTEEKPDLVVITGDIAFPVPFMAGTMNNLNPAKMIATLMEHLGVYWIPMFGNHDTEIYSYYNREDVANFYESLELKHCLFKKGDSNLSGFGNSIIKVKNSDGIVTQTMFMLDSHSYTDDDKFGLMWKYDNIKDNQIDWYKENVTNIAQNNIQLINKIYADNEEKKNDAINKYGKSNSILFFHIPLKEYKDAWTEYVNNGYSDTENLKYIYGTNGEAGEAVCHGIGEDDLFETIEQLDGNRGIFCGHDHLNNYSVMYKGVRLTFGYSIDYLAYSGISKIGSQRGCTVITINPDSTFNSVAENYYQDKYHRLDNSPKEDVTMQDLNANDNI